MLAVVIQHGLGAPKLESAIASETMPSVNTAHLTACGPIELRGDLALIDPDGAVRIADTRMTVCRCGASGSKPFCDGSHTRIGFKG